MERTHRNIPLLREKAMSDGVLVSVIMPVYNSEAYIENAVDSVLRQEFDGFELIVVDDGSKDGSGAICDRLAQKDERVVVLHKPNGGICSARNAGLDLARGEYITFCDNDDEYLPGLISENYTLAKRENADVVRFCRAKTETYNGKVITETVTGGFSLQAISAGEIGRKYGKIKKARSGVWTGMYRKEYLIKHGIRFDESMRFGYEDVMFNLSCYEAGGTIVLNPGVYYRWLQRLEHSTTGKYSKNVYDSIIRCLHKEEKIVRKYNVINELPGEWQLWLTKDYIAELYDRLRPGIEWLDKKTIRSTLKTFREEKAFSIRTGRREQKYLLQQGFTTWLMWNLFQNKKLMLLYRLIYLKKRK